MCSPSSVPVLKAGTSLSASVGEPWDFRSSSGDNCLTGAVVQCSNAGETPEWVICDVSSFSHKGVEVDRIAMVMRSRSDSGLLELLAGRESVTVNMLFSSERPIDRAQLQKGLSDRNGLDFWVGTIRILPDTSTTGV